MSQKNVFWERFKFFLEIVAILVGLIAAFVFDIPQKVQERFSPSLLKVKLDGLVVDTDGNPIAGALVTIDLISNIAETTSTAGGFLFKQIPGKPGDPVRVFVSNKGYINKNQYFSLPGPVRITLEK
jgi:hypothetical protein